SISVFFLSLIDSSFLCTVLSYFLVLFFHLLPTPPRSTLFPYTTLFRSVPIHIIRNWISEASLETKDFACRACGCVFETQPHALQDRKSTRLNSSHGSISYAVFCLKKKKNNKTHNKNNKNSNPNIITTTY